MKQYLDYLDHIMTVGRTTPDRSGFWLRSAFGYQMRFDLREGFPCLTTKKMPIKTMIRELLWFISGDTNTAKLHEHNIHIWDALDSDADRDIGPLYGYQWRKWPDYNGGHIDQLANAINEIKTNPYSKAILVSAWNVAQLKEMALPPCHSFFQFFVRKNELSLQWYQRSSDAFLGAPFNIFQYALLLSMVAQVTGKVPADLVMSIGVAHIYKNHKEAVMEQLKRKPKKLPTMKINPKVKNIDDFRETDFELIDYDPYPAIKAPFVHLG